MLAFFFALLQLVVSAKAGHVNMVYGQASIAVGEQAAVGKPVHTGPRSHLEILLTPDSFARLDENSTAVLDSVDLDHVVFRLNTGSALIAARDVDSSIPIHVISGELHVLVLSKGIYRFTGGSAIVIDGRISPADSNMTVGKGRVLTVVDRRYVETPFSKDADSNVKKFLGEPKAGFVNALEGEVNVRLHEQVREGQIIRTGRGGRVELVAGPNEYLRLDENSVAVFDSIKLSRPVYRLTPNRRGPEEVGAVIVNEPLRSVFRISGAALLETAGRVSRFINNAEFILVRRPVGAAGKQLWLPVRQGIRTTSRGGSDALSMDLDALDIWSERRSYELARATQMAYYPDMPRQNGWIFSPDLNALTFLPGAPSRNVYGYASVPLFPVTSIGRGNTPPRRGGRQ